MAKIKDKGKVWFLGSFRPIEAIRIDETIFAVGLGEDEKIDCWIDRDHLCVDLHKPQDGKRIARRFKLGLKGQKTAGLFSGFENTKHEEILVVAPDDQGVEERKITGKEYERFGCSRLDRKSFWECIGF